MSGEILSFIMCLPGIVAIGLMITTRGVNTIRDIALLTTRGVYPSTDSAWLTTSVILAPVLKLYLAFR